MRVRCSHPIIPNLSAPGGDATAVGFDPSLTLPNGSLMCDQGPRFRLGGSVRRSSRTGSQCFSGNSRSFFVFDFYREAGGYEDRTDLGRDKCDESEVCVLSESGSIV